MYTEHYILFLVVVHRWQLRSFFNASFFNATVPKKKINRDKVFPFQAEVLRSFVRLYFTATAILEKIVNSNNQKVYFHFFLLNSFTMGLIESHIWGMTSLGKYLRSMGQQWRSDQGSAWTRYNRSIRLMKQENAGRPRTTTVAHYCIYLVWNFIIANIFLDVFFFEKRKRNLFQMG